MREEKLTPYKKLDNRILPAIKYIKNWKRV